MGRGNLEGAVVMIVFLILFEVAVPVIRKLHQHNGQSNQAAGGAKSK
jgi:hypothetical protein